ncbi:hypothetical protein L6452_23847 [Arctium lappa]|uniref:Uncharacterized protein n=1 Tax=Arctium lappa TaxID=4217 RepID=A0ACB9ACR5_ARCLA|nr:hypothetical protein L6452_23847 [Arctium lappa]
MNTWRKLHVVLPRCNILRRRLPLNPMLFLLFSQSIYTQFHFQSVDFLTICGSDPNFFHSTANYTLTTGKP